MIEGGPGRLTLADQADKKMTKSELIEVIAREQSHLAYRDVELAVKCMIEQMSQALASGERIEIRGFGSFSLHFRPPRVGRNPKTGDSVELNGKYVPRWQLDGRPVLGLGVGSHLGHQPELGWRRGRGRHEDAVSRLETGLGTLAAHSALALRRRPAAAIVR